MMRLKIALLCALLVPLGTAKADVVTLSNSSASPAKTTATSLFINLTTSGLGAFNLSTLTLSGMTGNDDVISFALKNSSGTTINSISGTGLTATDGVLTFGNANTFGQGTYWLEVSGLNGESLYNQGASANLTSDNTGLISNMSPGLVDAVGSTTVVSGVNLFHASLVVAVPEPATMILTGSALAAGAIGAYFKRRRKPQTEIAA